MTRRNFTRKTRAAVFLRAGGCCENPDCGARLKTGEGIYDHVLPDALGGEPTEENCKLICSTCNKAKTADDVRRIRKADRQRDKLSGAFKRRGKSIPGSKDTPWKKKLSGEVVRR